MRSVSVGIAARNAERNIGFLLRAVFAQTQEHIAIVQVVVHSDQSTDRTVEVVRGFADPRLVLIESPSRRGFTEAVRAMFAAMTADVFVLLNDDVQIADPGFLERAVLPIFQDAAGLAGMNVQPLPPRSFVERAFVSTFRVYERIREAMPNPDNVLTLDGAAMSLSPRFARSVAFPVNPAEAGNLDAFLYFTCAEGGFKYRHAADAVVWSRSPSTLRDYLRRSVRNQSQGEILRKKFGARVLADLRPPFSLYLKSIVPEILMNPLGALFVFAAGFYIRHKAIGAARHASATWDVVESSKALEWDPSQPGQNGLS
jgi:glycosyltransferase involved in cell wall biosynthesis